MDHWTNGLSDEWMAHLMSRYQGISRNKYPVHGGMNAWTPNYLDFFTFLQIGYQIDGWTDPLTEGHTLL